MEPIADGVYRISGGAVQAYLVDGDEGVVLVDTLLPGRASPIDAALSAIGRSPSDVRAICLTHAHADHTGNAARMARDGAAVYASAADAPAIRGERRPPPPPVARSFPPIGWLSRLLPSAEPVEVTGFAEETGGSSLPGDLTAIDTPGHTPGHRSFRLDRSGGIVFVGDAAHANRRHEVRRGWFNRADVEIDGSIRHLATFDFEIALFGHAPPIERRAADAFRRFAASLG